MWKNVNKLNLAEIKKELFKEKFEKLDSQGKLESYLSEKRKLNSYRDEN